ncbi:MAG: dTDP-4-dehydrorhamnose 3,5-epimerase family protein [Chloroflexota bacterium]
MSEGWRESTLPGVVRRTLTTHADPRGSFSELWRASWTADLAFEFRQANVSRSSPGVLRAMHFHLRQADLWVVLDGRAFVAVADLRGALTGGREAPPIETFELAPGEAVLIPAGVAHGFLAVEALQLAYLVTAEYDGTDEHGFAWDDPTVAIPWPASAPILSDRDRGNPGLAEAVAAARVPEGGPQAGQSSTR